MISEKTLSGYKQNYLCLLSNAWRFSTGGCGSSASAAPESFGLSVMVAYQGGQHKQSNHTALAGCALQKRKHV